MFEVEVVKPFYDVESNNKKRVVGEIIKLKSATRVRKLIGMKLVRLLKIHRQSKAKRTGKKVIIYQSPLYKIGGIETWCQHIAKQFKNKDITFLVDSADFTQVLRLAKYCDVIIDDKISSYKCDILIIACAKGAPAILDRVESKKFYQCIHADFSYIKKLPGWQSFMFQGNNRRDAFLAASETARKGLKTAYGADSVVVTNPLAPTEKDAPTVFLTLSRATAEKGFKRIIEMARRFEDEGRNFIWLICSTMEQSDVRSEIESIPGILVVSPSVYATGLLHSADYLVQLSDNESYCYSIREALQANVPVIATEFDEAKKIIKDGKNGFILKHDLSNLDTDKIFKTKFKMTPYTEEIDKNWEKVFNGEL